MQDELVVAASTFTSCIGGAFNVAKLPLRNLRSFVTIIAREKKNTDQHRRDLYLNIYYNTHVFLSFQQIDDVFQRHTQLIQIDRGQRRRSAQTAENVTHTRTRYNSKPVVRSRSHEPGVNVIRPQDGHALWTLKIVPIHLSLDGAGRRVALHVERSRASQTLEREAGIFVTRPTILIRWLKQENSTRPVFPHHTTVPLRHRSYSSLPRSTRSNSCGSATPSRSRC